VVVIVSPELDQKCFVRLKNSPNSFSAGALPWTPTGESYNVPHSSHRLGREITSIPHSIQCHVLFPLENFLRTPMSKDAVGGNSALEKA